MYPKSYWNYRVMKRKENGQTYYAMYEVYYTNGKIRAWTDKHVEPIGDTPSDLKQDLKWMLEAFEKPILDYDKEGKKIDKIRKIKKHTKKPKVRK